MNENFTNLRTKAALLEKKGDTKTAEALRDKSLKIATEADMNHYGYNLLRQKKYDEAIAVFSKTTKYHPIPGTCTTAWRRAMPRREKRSWRSTTTRRRSRWRRSREKQRINGILTTLKA